MSILRHALCSTFPRRATPYWTDQTIADMEVRYPGIDMAPYRAAHAERTPCNSLGSPSVTVGGAGCAATRSTWTCHRAVAGDDRSFGTTLAVVARPISRTCGLPIDGATTGAAATCPSSIGRVPWPMLMTTNVWTCACPTSTAARRSRGRAQWHRSRRSRPQRGDMGRRARRGIRAGWLGVVVCRGARAVRLRYG